MAYLSRFELSEITCIRAKCALSNVEFCFYSLGNSTVLPHRYANVEKSGFWRIVCFVRYAYPVPTMRKKAKTCDLFVLMPMYRVALKSLRRAYRPSDSIAINYLKKRDRYAVPGILCAELKLSAIWEWHGCFGWKVWRLGITSSLCHSDSLNIYHPSSDVSIPTNGNQFWK